MRASEFDNPVPLDDWEEKDVPQKKQKLKKKFSIEWAYEGTNNWKVHWKKYETEKARDDAVTTLNNQKPSLLRCNKIYRKAVK